MLLIVKQMCIYKNARNNFSIIKTMKKRNTSTAFKSMQKKLFATIQSALQVFSLFPFKRKNFFCQTIIRFSFKTIQLLSFRCNITFSFLLNLPTFFTSISLGVYISSGISHLSVIEYFRLFSISFPSTFENREAQGTLGTFLYKFAVGTPRIT